MELLRAAIVVITWTVVTILALALLAAVPRVWPWLAFDARRKIRLFLVANGYLREKRRER